MSHLYLPWGTGERYTNRQQARNQFASTLDLHNPTYDYQEPTQRQRSPSLPPIHNTDPDRHKEDRRTKEVLNRNISSPKRFNFYEEDAEGDTSGYGSETIIRGHVLQSLTASQSPVIAWQQDDNDSRNTSRDRQDGLWSSRSPRSGGTTADEGRPRWGDRGVATGRLWEPTAPNARLPQMSNQKKGTPSWVERGLNMIDNAADVLVIDQRSSTNSGFDCDRSSYNGSDEGKTYLRGQNVPLEPEIKAQRENKRIKALELQSAILNQLEDQEKRRQEERAMKLREERLEELRLQRQQEEDRVRAEEERRRNEEKQLQEQRKLETLKKALDEAEKKAKLEKEKRFSCLKQNLIKNIPTETRIKTEETDTNENTPTSLYNGPISPTKSSRTYNVDSAKSEQKENNSHQMSGFNSPTSSIAPGNLNLFIHNVPPMALNSDNHQYNIVPIGINGHGEIVSAPPNGIQLAVLVPQNLSNNLYSVSLNSLNTEMSEAGKILTPRKYRIPKTKDVCTQTDLNLNRSHTKIVDLELERNIDKDYPNIDENAPQDNHHNLMKKDRRYRSEERFKKDLENRPKWGVNRPAAQYKKQSEKDPFYSQKRKMRQKYRAQARQYLSQSSDDSRSPSPPTRSDSKPRHSLSQSYWKTKRSIQDIPRNNNEPEADSNITEDFTHLDPTSANETENKKSPKMSPSKRITLSQKFINDKYGNRKLWIDEANGKSTTFLFDPENRKKLIDQINMTKRDFYDRNEDQENKLKY